MMYQETILPTYINYWNRDFQRILLWYYSEWSCKDDSPVHNTILCADRHSSFFDMSISLPSLVFDNRSQIASNEYFFSVSMYYVSTIPQVICKIVSQKAARAFLNSSGWPAISLGLGGFMSSEQILYESDLLPFPNEVNRYISLLKIIHPFHKKELIDYMSGKVRNLSPNEYAIFCEEVYGLKKQIVDELDNCKSSFITTCEGIRDVKKDVKHSVVHLWNSMYLKDVGGYYDK